MRLNIAHIEIKTATEAAKRDAEISLRSAIRSLGKGFWMSEYTYVPSAQHLAKMWYRSALLLELQADRDMAEQALVYINRALDLAPGDTTIIKEQEIILMWIQWL
jgi:hypothetical protein